MSSSKEIWTIQKILQWSKQYFETNGVDSPQLDAQLLLGHVLGMSKIDLIIQGQRPLDADELAEYKKLIIRRAKGREPIAYILGEKEFWSMPLNVSPDVLIPRPDTECLVERAIEYLKSRRDQTPLPWSTSVDKSHLTYEKIDAREAYYQAVEAAELLEKAQNTADSGTPSADTAESSPSHEADEHSALERAAADRFEVLDMGTGSGAIALALAKEMGDLCHITAVDISAKALEMARKNADTLGLNLDFVESDLFRQVRAGSFDLIVSNPPYITKDEMAQLAPEVRQEPVLALEAGVDGLDVYRRLIPEAFARLKPNGALMLEMGCTQQNAVSELLQKAGFKTVRMFTDYAGLPRVMAALK